MIKKKCTVPIYNVNFTMLKYDKPEELQAMWPDKRFEHDLSTWDAGVIRVDGELFIAFCMDDGKPSPGIIAHEAKHFVNDVFLWVCQELDRENDEAECYLLQWVVNTIHDFIDSK